MKQRINRAAKKLLENSGYEILSESDPFDVVAFDNEREELVFVVTCYETDPDKGFAECNIDRGSLELAGIQYLMNHRPEQDVRIRFDEVSFKVLDHNLAFTRHHINILHTDSDF